MAKQKKNVRSSRTGRFVNQEMAETNPNETVTETVREPLQELVEAVESATNVQTISYHSNTKKWEIIFKNDLETNTVETRNLIEFLENV
jgi:hypothetical protein